MRLSLFLAASIATALVVACTSDEPDSVESTADEYAAECCAITIQAIVPEGTGTVYLAGNLPELGPWNADGMVMTGDGVERIARVHAAPGTELEYKFTLGKWEYEALGPDGLVPDNQRLAVEADAEVSHEIAAFKDPLRWIEDWKGSGVEGQLIYWLDVESEFLGPTRHVEVWLPPGYDEDQEARFPVLYMSDGQNLFDPRIANTGVDWGVDEAIVRLVETGVMPPVIVVGAWSTDERGPEYSPLHGASDYARFLIEELIPRVDSEFRTLTGPENTAHMGSSMGGLLSFYLVTQHPDVFGSCGCVSTHFPLSEAVWQGVGYGEAGETPDETPFIVRDIEAGLTVPEGTRYWFDYGTEGLDGEYGPTHEALRARLLELGLVEGEDFLITEYQGAFHTEASWRERLDDPLTFLFGQRVN
ncbi:MAG: alpha/beta hydrolase-fold protein [marine benthic group bacterium]|nr:alpha/beta hydrolase-fold protein [Gemmatimonadota bacterium]